MVSSGHFEWDDAKAAANLIKHGVGCEIAPDVFLDEALRDFDASHVTDAEARSKAVAWLKEGYSRSSTRCVKAIISVRRSNAKERRAYASLYP